MRVIEQEFVPDVQVENIEKYLNISDDLNESIWIDKQGAKQLIEVLMEFVNENQD